jgi:hypothetical protein
MARAPRAARAGSIEQLLAAKEIVIHCGSGGVGKTTAAAAVAAMAAVHHGGKVLVVTVDPARRLANALGLEAFGNLETRVPHEAFLDAGVQPRGELPAGTPLLYVPYLFQRSHGVRATRQVAEHLAEELGF